MRAPANTGRDNNKSQVVTSIEVIKRGVEEKGTPSNRLEEIVEMKFTEAKIEEAPAKWSEKIAKSTAGPEWAIFLDRGGYTVHPVPTPLLAKEESNKRKREGGKSQNLKLFIRGKHISAKPNIIGINQFPNPPIITGMTKKNY